MVNTKMYASKKYWVQIIAFIVIWRLFWAFIGLFAGFLVSVLLCSLFYIIYKMGEKKKV